MGLSPFRNHFLGWAKLERQWTPAAGIQTVNPPTTTDVDVTIALSPSETAGGTELIRIPITAGAVFTGASTTVATSSNDISEYARSRNTSR